MHQFIGVTPERLGSNVAPSALTWMSHTFRLNALAYDLPVTVLNFSAGPEMQCMVVLTPTAAALPVYTISSCYPPSKSMEFIYQSGISWRLSIMAIILSHNSNGVGVSNPGSPGITP